MRVNPAHIHPHNHCGPFAFLVDESLDIAMKEQMTAILCYVDKKGHVIEHFLIVDHVKNTTI